MNEEAKGWESLSVDMRFLRDYGISKEAQILVAEYDLWHHDIAAIPEAKPWPYLGTP